MGAAVGRQSWRRRKLRIVAALACAVACCLTVASSPALGAVQRYGTNDFGGFRNVLPPGTNGLATLSQALAFRATGIRPPHSNDQLAMYADLTAAAPRIRPSQLDHFFKDATFGVRRGNVGRIETPAPGVTIIRDKRFGVPHIYGRTRSALMFGIGWAAAEDRLFFMDVLRHAGQGDLAQFAGGSNAAMDQSMWATAPYTHRDLVNQVSYVAARLPHGRQIIGDASSFVAGINAYIKKAQNPTFTATMMPAEYPALGMSRGPQPFTVEDLVSIATVVGAILGSGGGRQLENAFLYQSLKRRFGAEHCDVAGSPERVPGRCGERGRTRKRPPAHSDHSGFGTFLSLVDPADPEAPTTAHGRSFPYQTLPQPQAVARGSIALPDRGSVRFVNDVVAGATPRGGPGLAGDSGTGIGLGLGLDTPANVGPALLAFPREESNALLISAAHGASRHPLAVMGPQTGYFSPETLMEEDIHGPGIDADGAAFPGINLYVELGHGRDYAWSATSAGQNIIDTFAVPLCDPSRRRASIDSRYYLLRGRCTRMETLTRREAWEPNITDATPAGSLTLQTQRTAYGIVIARARIRGRPVVYTNLRSTYLHELDSVLGFYLLNNPAQIRRPRDFFNAAYRIEYTFNLFYVDDKHIAYFNAGLNPLRAVHTNPLFPTWAGFPWRGYRGAARLTPNSLTEHQMPASAHPQTIDQAYLTSWNNKPAPGYDNAATGQQFASVYRSQLLDRNINAFLARHHGKMTLTDLVNAMGNAGTQDLRGVEVLPYALRIIGNPRDSTVARAARELRLWVATGAHRINRVRPGASGIYQQTDAVRIMDAWWPLLVKADFQPVLGARLLSEVEGAFPINDQPGHGAGGSHVGSAWETGFYGIVQKDLRAALGKRVAGPLNRIYCGNGSLAACRAALEHSLRQALAMTPRQVYPADGVCRAGDQMCSDSIQFRPIGAITEPLVEWINRPTFQQADEILGHRRDATTGGAR